MNFKCILNLLEEKEYIEVEYDEMFISIKTEFEAVRDKILETLPDYAGYHYEKNRITITTVEDVEKFCSQLNKSKNKDYISYINLRAVLDWYEYHAFLSAIRKSDKFELKRDIGNLDVYKITDTIAKEIYFENKKQKQNEVEDFINSLP